MTCLVLKRLTGCEKIPTKHLTSSGNKLYTSKAGCENDPLIWGLSSAGRASALQAEGHRFEPYRPHSSLI